MIRLLLLLASGLLVIPAWAADCVKMGSTCLDATPCKTISGVQVCLSQLGETCWKYEDTYDCVGAGQLDDCQALRDKGCGQIGSKCIKTNSDGLCTMYEQTYQCQTSPASTSTVMNCGTQTYCMEGNCFNTGHKPDSDFVNVIVSMEGVREAGAYMDPATMQLFKGYDNRCTKGFFGLKNCCETSGGGGSMSNAGILMGIVDNAGGTIGSTYVYDALFMSDAPTSFLNGYEMLFGTGGSPGVTMYGITVSIGADGALAFGFDPTSFAISIGMMILQELLACEQDEMVLSMKRGQNLCHFVGSYCSMEIPIIDLCIETTESYCCFNSRLARIINEQGRGQIGKGWGGGESPDCSGFTPEQLQALDFSTMNLSEFYAEIQPKMPDLGSLSTKNQQIIQQKVNNYYQQ